MDTDMEDEPLSPDIDHETMNVSIEPRITNRAHGGIRTDKTRFIRPVERQRMRPWLIDHLDQNDIPGLVWQERTEMIFRISWKHAANQCFNMQKDTNLFERWAIHTGRHQDSDHKRWKANFRCALNSLPDVTEMKEQGVKKGNNAFKVYRFLDEKEAKLSKDGKPKKKKEPMEFKDDGSLMKFKEELVMSYDTGEGTSGESGGAAGSSIPNLHQLVPSGVDMLLEADNQEKSQPINSMDNLQEILAAATASLAAGGDAVALEKISIEQLSRLGEVSKMKLDIRQSDRKRRKKEVSGILNVFLCNWCEKVFPTKVDLFQHFLIIHQDKLLSGEEYGARKHSQPTEKLQQEIEDLEKKVLGFTQESYQNESEEVIEDGQVVDLSSNNSMTSQEVYIEDQVLDLSVAGALAKHPQSQSDVALDLSMSTSKQKTVQKSATSQKVQKRRRSNASDREYSNKFGNYGLAGAPRTKRQLSLLLKRKEEEEEKARKQAEAQHSMEDLVHAEILISLKSGSKEENETEGMELENGVENVESEDKKSITKIDKTGNAMKDIGEQDSTKTEEAKEDIIDDDTEVVEEEVASMDNVVYLELNDGSKVAVYKQADVPNVESEKKESEEVKNKNVIPVVVGSYVETEKVNVIHSDQDGASGKPYKCALCPERFEDPTELLTHVSVHKTEYKCSVCTKVMTDKDVYLNHIESHLPAGKLGQICEVCNVHFSTVEELQKHIKGHESGMKLYKCGNCGKTYQTVKECVNCAVCLQTRGKEKQAERKDDKVALVEKKVVVKDPGKIPDEKGAAGASETAVKVSDTKKIDHLKEKIVNTGQKNLKGEPVITPVAGSDNLTGINNKVVTGNKDVVSKRVDILSTQESFELPIDCLEDDTEVVTQNNVRNDVVDGENSSKIHNDMKAGDKVLVKKESSLDRMDENILIPKSENLTKKCDSEAQFVAIIKDHSSTVQKEVFSVTKSNIYETIKTEENSGTTICQKGQKYGICKEKNESEEDRNRHKKSLEETIEDKVKKKVFHCGICDIKLHINDVESHLKTHKASKFQKTSKEEDCTCVICKETFPIKHFYTHWKSHSVYDLSKAQSLQIAKKTGAGQAGTEKQKLSFVCNLCSVKFATFEDLKLHVKTHLGPRFSVKGAKVVLNKNFGVKACDISRGKGKKRKESDEKRITGKRPKAKKFKANYKALEVKDEALTVKKIKEEPKDLVRASPAITAALKTGPKFCLTTSSREEVANKCFESSQVVPLSNASVAQVVQLDKQSLVVLKNDVDMQIEDKGGVQVFKRKTTVQLEAISPKKQKSTNDNVSDLNDSDKEKLLGKPIDKTIKENDVEKVGAYNQDVNTKHSQVIKSEPIDSENFSFPDKSSLLEVNGKMRPNAKPATLHRLQQKILLFKEGDFKVARPILNPVLPTILTSHQQVCSTGRPITHQTRMESKEPVLQGNKSAMGSALTEDLDDLSEDKLLCNSKNLSSKEKTSPTSVNDKNDGINAKPGTLNRLQQKILLIKDGEVSRPIVCQTTSEVKEQMLRGNESAVEKVQTMIGLVKGQNIPAVSMQDKNNSVKSEDTSLSLVQSLSGTKSINSTKVLSASPQTYILSMTSASSVSAVPQIPVVISQSMTNFHQGPALVNSILQVQSSVTRPFAVSSTTNPISSSKQVSLVGSLQNLTRCTTGIPVLSRNSKETLANITSLKTAPSNISTSLNVPQQQQKQLNIMKSVIGRVNQPAIVNAPAMSPALVTQGGLQQAVSGTPKFPFSNIIYAPHNKSSVSLKASPTTKPSAYQLVWLPVSQPVSQSVVKDSPTITEAGLKPQTFHNLSLENTVLGAKLRARHLQALNQLKSDQSNDTLSSQKEFTTGSLTSTSDTVMSTLGKEKSSEVIHTSSEPTLPTSDDVRHVSSQPANQFIAGKSGYGLCLTCAVCKQLLNDIQEMSTHVCKIYFSSSMEKKSESLSDSSENKTNLKPRVKRVSSYRKTVTTQSSQVTLTSSSSTFPTRSVTKMSNAFEATPSTLPYRELGVTSSTKDLPEQNVNEGNTSNFDVVSLTSSTEGLDASNLSPKSLDSSSKSSELYPPKVKEFIIKTKSCTGNESSSLGKSTVESEDGESIEESMQSKEDMLNDEGKTNSEEKEVITLYPCVICDKTFSFEGFKKHAKMHMVEAEIEEEVIADVSERTREEQYMEDLSINAERKFTESSRKSDVYRCYFCSITYDDEKSLSQHYTQSHPSMTNYLCPANNCAQIFFEVKECDMHYAFKHQHECRFCLQRFRTFVEFQTHIEQHYENRILTYFSCVKCKTRFSNKKAFYRHCRSGSNKCPDTYIEKHIDCQQCRCCSINFTSKECLKLHFKRKYYHGIEYRCCICREVISKETGVIDHMSAHFSLEDNYVGLCHICCMIFPYKTVLSNHLSSADHNRAETLHQRLLDKYDRVLKDDEIMKTPADSIGKLINKDGQNEVNSKDDQKISDSKLDEKSENLERGKVSKGKHSKVLFSCEQCNVCFKTLFRLKQHIAISHTREQAQRKSISYIGRRLHNYHTRRGRKSIVCEFCCKRFQHITDLRKHIHSSHDEKVYLACKNPDCEMNFNSFFEYEFHVCKSMRKGKDVAEISSTMVDAGQPSMKSIKGYMLQYYVEDCKELLDKIAGTVESVQEHLGDHFTCHYCERRLHSCEQLKFHLINQHAEKLAQCVDCLEYFFHQSALLEHRRDCAVKGFSDEDFHTKKKILGCDVCFRSFIYILGLTKFLRDLKFMPDKYKSSGSKCFSRKGVYDLKLEGDDFGIEENSMVPFYNTRKFVCINCKNEYCNAEDFYICMKSRLTTEKNKVNEDESKMISNDDTVESDAEVLDDESMPLFEQSKVDLKNVFFCNECESVVCYQDGGICLASLKHPCSGSNTLI